MNTQYETVGKKKISEIIELLSKLDTKQLMAYWIDQEIKEAEMYHYLSELSKEVQWDERVPKLFFRLYQESLGHAEALLKMFKEMFPKEKPPKVDLPALEVELSKDELKELVKSKRLKDILEYLMGTEKLAHDVYRYLAEKSPDEEAKATLIWLSKIEEGHYRLLRDLYVTLFGMPPE
ncbi:ferritin-like domain-containing protein [Thermococcus sp.]